MRALLSRTVPAFVLLCVAVFGANTALAAQPQLGRVNVAVPARAEAGATFAITLTLPRGTAAVEGRVLVDSNAAEVVGLAPMGGGAALTPAEITGGYAFAAYNLRGSLPQLKVAVVSHVSGRVALNVVIDAAADAAGRRLPLATSVAGATSVGLSNVTFAAPVGLAAAPHGALRPAMSVRDVVADGIVGKLDLDEVTAAWDDAHANDASCTALRESAADVNNDGCIDVVDLQVVAAARGQRLAGTLLRPSSDTFALLTTTPRASSTASSSAANAVAAGTFVVNSTLDTVDAQADDGICADSKGRCTLRAAITSANWSHGPNRIEFNLDGAAPVLIQMDPNLPGLLLNDRSGGTTIDGYTQPGSKVNTADNVSNAVPGIQLRGTGKTPRLVALRIVSAGNIVRGIAFNNNYRAIVIEEADAHENQILGNWFGFSGPGTMTQYNGHYNMWIADGANHNVVGTPALADRNVSGGAIKGLAMYGPGTDFNTIQNNVFCITPNGASPAECAVGIDFSFGPKHNLIGGTGAHERNVFGRTRQQGIEFAHGVDKGADLTWVTAYNSIINNWVGFRADGSYNADYRSGWVAPRDGANDSNGINLSDCTSFNVAEGNFVGSVFDGVNIMWDNETGNEVRNNTIGVSPLGQAAPLARYGINVRNAAHGHTIVGNIIKNAGTYGIALIQKDDAAIEISRNIITDMAGRAIFLTSGANGGVQPPQINSATAIAVGGKAAAGATVEVFLASRAAGSNGLPVQYVGSATANGTGNWNLPVALSVGQVVTALQTTVSNNSSALANNVTLGKGGAVVAPVANFTASQQSGTLRESFTDTSTGGAATSWAWTFGDGATSTAQSPSHTYASAGTYSVNLTATNSAGSSTITKSVVVSGTAPTAYAADAFGRTVSNGWGSASTGGAYTVTGSASNYKVVNGVGDMLLTQPNSNASAILYGVTARDVDLKFRFTVDNAPTGGNVMVYAATRRTSSGEYRPRISLNADGTASISVSKLVGTTETRIGSAVVVPGVTVAAGSYIWFRAQVVGSGTTTIRVKAWTQGQAEPGSWQLTVTDTESALQVAGNVGFRLYMSSSVTDAPIQVGFDDYSVNPS